MPRPPSFVALACALACGCASVLDYDSLTNGPAPAHEGTGDGSAAGAGGDAGAPGDDAGDARDGALPNGPAVDAAPETTAPDGTATGATVDAASPIDAAPPVEAAPATDGPVDPCAAVSSFFNGRFCGSETQWSFDPTGADPNTLYTCTDGRVSSAVVCPHGCMLAGPTTDDQCNP